jgi:uncharacterized membrane protein YedE/YeeE
MAENSSSPLQQNFITLSIVVLTIITILAVWTNFWVLTAIPIGFLFGFFLQKGNLCGSSAFSEVVLFKDWSKVWGLWISIVIGMVAFAVLDLLGWVSLNPKPFIWANYIVGGILFGVGMVLAGGCVSGCLFKAGTGNINSMAALPAIAIGVALVEYGPLFPLHSYLKTLVLKSDGASVTLSSLSGLPFWTWALFFVILTIIGVYISERKTESKTEKANGLKLPLIRSWKPWQAGLMIGLLGFAAYLSSAASGRNYPLGVTHGVLHVQLLVTESNLNHVYKVKAETKAKAKAKVESADKADPLTPEGGAEAKKIAVVPKPKGKKISWWLIALVISLVVGSWVSAKLSGEAKLYPKPPGQVITAFIGGLLVGTGAAIGTGCVIGNIISGWALMSLGTVLFGIVVILSNWVTTYFYLRGSSR